MAAGCGGQRAVAAGDGRQAVRRSRTPPPPPAGAGSAPEGLPAVLLRGAAARPQKNKTRKTAVLRAWFGAYR